MIDPKLRLENILTKLKGRNCRITPQRLAILKILCTSELHPSAEMIHEQVKSDFPTTSLATVYKTLTLLKGMEEVKEFAFSADNNRYDGKNPNPHSHLICIKCKAIMDLTVFDVSKLSKKLSQKTGYQIVNHRVDFYGVCPQCQKE